MVSRRELHDQTTAEQGYRLAAVQSNSVKPAIVGMGTRDLESGQYEVLLSDGSVEQGEKLFNSSLPTGQQVLGTPTEGGWLLDERDVTPARPIDPAVEEIEFDLLFFGMRPDDQPYTFRCEGFTKELSFANAETFDLLGRGRIKTRIRTKDRRLRLTFEAKLDGTKATNANCSFHTVKKIKLATVLTAKSSVREAGSSNAVTGEPDFVPDLRNWLVLNDIKLKGDSENGGGDFDLTTFVDAPFPAESVGFIDRFPGVYEAAKVVGTIPALGPTRDHSIFISGNTQNLGQRSYYEFTTTYTFVFK